MAIVKAAVIVLTFLCLLTIGQANPVRLVSTTWRTFNLTAGRLEVFVNGQWGTVCDHSFRPTDADVACQQLGFIRNNAYQNAGSVGYPLVDSSVPILLCESSSNLLACSNATSGQHCVHSEDIILSCTGEGSLRLVRGINASPAEVSSSGRLEIYLNGTWGTICNTGFYYAADVACKQMGFSASMSHGFASSLGFTKASPDTPILVGGFGCSRVWIPLTLLQCTQYNDGLDICIHSYDLALTCSTASTYNGDVRLVGHHGSIAASAGRLEIFLNGSWGTVCAVGFNMDEADTVCQQLGFLYAKRVGDVGSFGYAEGSGLIFFDDMDTTIGKCDVFFSLIRCARPAEKNCSHSQDIAVECSNSPDLIRLVSTDGRSDNLSSGRLELFINDQWGTVCDSSFRVHDADVACRQLGFIRGNAHDIVGWYNQVSTSVPIWLDYPECSSASSGNSNLRGCFNPHGTGRVSQFCDHHNDIVLSCVGEGSLRLVGSIAANVSAFTRDVPSSGRLEVYMNGEWGTVCYDSSFGQMEANVACRQLGFSSSTAYGNVIAFNFSEASSSTHTVLYSVHCYNSSLSTLLQCTHTSNGYCPHYQEVALVCNDKASSTKTTTLPIPTSNNYEGHQENYSSDGTIRGRGRIIGGIVGGFLAIIFIIGLVAIIIYKRSHEAHYTALPSHTAITPIQENYSFEPQSATPPDTTEESTLPSYTDVMNPTNPENYSTEPHCQQNALLSNPTIAPTTTLVREASPQLMQDSLPSSSVPGESSRRYSPPPPYEIAVLSHTHS